MLRSQLLYPLNSGGILNEDQMFSLFTVFSIDSSEPLYVLIPSPEHKELGDVVLIADKNGVKESTMKQCPKEIKSFLTKDDEISAKTRMIHIIKHNEIDFEIKPKIIDFLQENLQIKKVNE